MTDPLPPTKMAKLDANIDSRKAAQATSGSDKAIGLILDEDPYGAANDVDDELQDELAAKQTEDELGSMSVEDQYVP